MTNVASVEVTYNQSDVLETANALLEFLEGQEVPVGLGVFGMTLALGGILAPRQLTVEEEQAFVKNVLEFISTQFAGGVPN